MKIRAGWRRVVQVKPYESEEFQMSVEGDWSAEELGGAGEGEGAEGEAKDAAAFARNLDAMLAEQGDALVRDRLVARAAADTRDVAVSAEQRRKVDRTLGGGD